MAPLLKLFEASAIASDHKVFFWARLKLTGIYVLILGIILFGFSATLYQSLEHNLVDASEDNFAGIESHHQFAQNTLSSVRSEIMLTDLFIILVAAGVSYVVAGYTLRPIQRALEAQKKFSEHASHELRTPLAVMKNDVEVLLRNQYPTKEQIHATLQSNIEEMDRMTTLTADLLMLARSQNTQGTAFDAIDLTEVAQHVLQKLQPLAERKGVKLQVSSAESLMVRGNRTGLERICMNVLQNAIEHTQKDGSVTLTTTQSDSRAILTITDTGSGIDAKDLPHVFERFYKEEGTGGSGLGLAIVKELVDQHGGTIELDSTKGLGTTISVILPAIL